MSTRRSIRHRFPTATAALAVTAVGVLAAAQPAMAGDMGKKAVKTVTVPILLSISGDATTIERIGTTDTFRLRMQGTRNLVTWFTDRPARRTGVMEARDLVTEWKGLGFDADPPNSALVLRSGDQAKTIVVETTHPRFANGVLAFTIKPIASGAVTIPDAAPDADLFIDDASAVLPVDPAQMPVVALTPGLPATTTPTTTAPTDPAAPAAATTSAATTNAAATATAVPTDQLDWSLHSIIPASANGAKYVAKVKLNSEIVTPAQDLIFSIPAAALVGNFSDHHLDIASDSLGLYVAQHKGVDISNVA